MRYTVTLDQGDESEVIAHCPQLGLTSSGLTANNALDAMRENIRYHIEYCPCSSVGDADIQLEIGS